MGFMAKREEYANGAPETVVGATVKIEGDLVSEGDIRVDGMVSGKIKTSKNLYVGPEASIEADVEAASAMLAGTVKGDVKIKDSLTIEATGKIRGNIACARLSIAEGAMFSGSCTMPEAGSAIQDSSSDE